MGKRASKGQLLASMILGAVLGVAVWHVAHSHLAKTRLGQAAEGYIDHARLVRELRSHVLITPSEQEHGFCPDSLVLLVHWVAREHGVLTFATEPAVGFAVGDGSLVLTAAHCLGLPKEKDWHGAISKQTAVLSPFYGDMFDATVVAVDPDADLAVLRPSWKGHPALPLGKPGDSNQIKQVYVATRSFNEEDPLCADQPGRGAPARHDCRARMEVVSVRAINGPGQGYLVHLGTTRYIANGWSGSPLIDMRTKAVVGVLTRLRVEQAQGRLISRTALGTNLATVSSFLRGHGLMGSALAGPAERVRPELALEAFTFAVKSVEALGPREFAARQNYLERLVDLRPDSPGVHLQMAYNAMALGPSSKDKKEDHQAQAERHLLKAIDLHPSDPRPRIMYMSLLRQHRRYAEAMTQAEAALALDANDDLALVTRVDILAETDPNRWLDAARALTEKVPDKAYAWFRYSLALRLQRRFDEAERAVRKATDLDPNEGESWWTLADLLRSQERFSEAVEAAQKAVDLDPNDISEFRPRLANCLSKAGQLKEAEQVYQLMLCKHPQRAYYWFWYAEHLVDHYTGRPEQVRQALERASDPNAQWPVEPNKVADLRRRVGLAD
jgi:pentatricopeptide repeat protein